jgi:hypothetical protein
MHTVKNKCYAVALKTSKFPSILALLLLSIHAHTHTNILVIITKLNYRIINLVFIHKL